MPLSLELEQLLGKRKLTLIPAHGGRRLAGGPNWSSALSVAMDTTHPTIHFILAREELNRCEGYLVLDSPRLA